MVIGGGGETPAFLAQRLGGVTDEPWNSFRPPTPSGPPREDGGMGPGAGLPRCRSLCARRLCATGVSSEASLHVPRFSRTCDKYVTDNSPGGQRGSFGTLLYAQGRGRPVTDQASLRSGMACWQDLIKPDKQCIHLHRAIIDAVVGTKRRQTTFTGIPTHTPGTCWPITNSSRVRDTRRFTGPVNL